MPGLKLTSVSKSGPRSPSSYMRPLQWRHNGPDGVSNHQPHDCLLKRLFGRRSKKTSKLRVTGLCAGNSPITGEFPPQRPVTRKMFPFDDVIMINWRPTSAYNPYILPMRTICGTPSSVVTEMEIVFITVATDTVQPYRTFTHPIERPFTDITTSGPQLIADHSGKASYEKWKQMFLEQASRCFSFAR